MDLGIKKVIKDGNGNAIVFTALIAAAVANGIPTILDYAYFDRINRFKQEEALGKRSHENYEAHATLEFYVWQPIYYFSLGAILYLLGTSYKTNAKIILTLAAAGVVYFAYRKNVERDKETEQLLKQKNH